MTVRPRLRDMLTDKTLALMLALGFSSGLPFLLVLGTQAARLAEAKVPGRADRPDQLGRSLLLAEVPMGTAD